VTRKIRKTCGLLPPPPPSDVDLAGAWHGWRIRNGILRSPDGDQITPERLRGILFVESLHKRRRKPHTLSQLSLLAAVRLPLKKP